ncbi:MAG TPA: AAA family ATPase [Burkholderiales bacterium]|nr:AAA family ATPase [Burkholderiales bacterium]
MAIDDWRRTSFDDSAQAALPPLDFCLPNLLAGSVGTVAAEPGIGKTSLLMQLGAAVAAGVPVAGGAFPAPASTGKVVFLAAEDPPLMLDRRAHFLAKSLDTAGGGVREVLERNFALYSVVGHAPMLVHERGVSRGAWDELSRAAAGARLVILDPLRAFHWCEDSDYRNLTLLYRILMDIAAARGCTILFSHHLVGPSYALRGEARDSAHGLDAFINPTRWVLNMLPMSEEEARAHSVERATMRQYVRVTVPKSNYGPPLASVWLRRSIEFEGMFERADLPGATPAR